MAAEPTEEAITNFVSFTSTTREQAINFLKANNLDSQKAINAYFEDPTGPQKVIPSTRKTVGPLADRSSPKQINQSAFGFGQQDNVPRVPATAPPSRPPSRVNMHDKTQGIGDDKSTGQPGKSTTAEKPSLGGWEGDAEPWAKATSAPGQGLSLAEREEQELQQAVAMSLNQDMGQQETGVTTTIPAATTSETQFGKATRDNYEECDWAMTLFNTSSQEVVVSPDPEDRKRVDDEPAFIRPTQDNLYLGGFLTILHEIPLAREALLLRNKLLYDYGHDGQWWNGQPINLPKIVTVGENMDEDNDWDEIIHETQRIMAFLDSTDRAFGSSDALANLKSITSNASDSEEVVTRLLEKWHAAAIRAEPENPLATAFMSQAYKTSPFDEGDEPLSKDLFLFSPGLEHDQEQTLYDVLDTAIWSDTPGDKLDDVWLEHVGEIIVMKLDSFNNRPSVGVKVPTVFYPDRYMSSCREISQDFRAKRLQVQEELTKVEELIKKHTQPKIQRGNLTRREVVEKTIESVPVALQTAIRGKSKDISAEKAQELTESMTRKLRALSNRIGAILEGLERQKQQITESLRGFSTMLTEPSQSPSEPPMHRYTLRGVCTKPHVTYVLKQNTAHCESGEGSSNAEKDGEYQWWRISFSAEDGKARQAAKEAQDKKATAHKGDVVGYTATKVREDEVLQAAHDEWWSVLLVYGSDSAMKAQVDVAPPKLQGFVKKDNKAFAVECRQSATEKEEQQSSRAGQQDSPPGNEASAEQVSGQEMQEKPGSALLGANTRRISKADSWAESEVELDHVEHAKPT
ncbi:hypothetical protein N7492_000431 [Penicillium capsulatum]|uniref:Ubiquitin interaction motif protein n=1 Tax=Penicillium capsulatum TaxID=69766 RepID=A0A9W9LYZ0_9EURO|nr:hypothetical protein N7492_000431 [Penicillium capsulatum]KAJ6130506.1 hypothetical protein N7512_003286 [Penicillium capsulatum]